MALGALALSSLVGAAGPAERPSAGPGPDLVLTAASMHPSPPREGDLLTIDVTIANHGDTAATSASLEVIDARPNGEVESVGRMTVDDSIGPGSFVTVSTPPFQATVVGWHTLTIRLGNVTPPESNPAEDTLSIRAAVRPAAPDSTTVPPVDGIRIEGLRDAGIVTIVVLVLGAVLVMVVGRLRGRPRGPGPLLPPPPDPPDHTPPPIWPP